MQLRFRKRTDKYIGWPVLVVDRVNMPPHPALRWSDLIQVRDKRIVRMAAIRQVNTTVRVRRANGRPRFEIIRRVRPGWKLLCHLYPEAIVSDLDFVKACNALWLRKRLPIHAKQFRSLPSFKFLWLIA